MHLENKEHNYYAWYFGFLLPDLCESLRRLPTQKNKQKLHEEFKEYLGYVTISNLDDRELLRFIHKVLMVAAREKGIFIRTNSKQPKLIERYPLGKVWEYL